MYIFFVLLPDRVATDGVWIVKLQQQKINKKRREGKRKRVKLSLFYTLHKPLSDTPGLLGLLQSSLAFW
jgi:hypothetical protein